MRLAGLAKGGYYPTPSRVVGLLAKRIQKQPLPTQRSRKPDNLRMLDPCCGFGNALNQLASSLRYRVPHNLETYGVELETERAQVAHQKLDHFLGSDLFQTQMTNNAFSILYLNPPYDFDQEQKRVEQAFLSHCTKYLMDNGLLIFIVPRHRLTVSARYLSVHYWNVRCYPFPEPDYEIFDQVVLMAYKRAEIRLDEQAEDDIRKMSTGPLEDLESLDQPIQEEWRVPTSNAESITFATQGIDPVVAATEANRTGLWTTRAMQDRFWPAQKHTSRPLMPLRRGHMAMLMAAGFLDNLCLENNDERVLVKGRTVKKMELISVDDQGGEVWKDKMQTTITSIDLSSGEIRDIQA